MTLKDYKELSSQVRLEIQSKGILTEVRNPKTGRWETTNIANPLIGTTNKGLYDRSQTRILEELRNRKNKIELPASLPLISTFDELHFACRIVVLRRILAEMDFKYDCVYGLSRTKDRKWHDIAYNTATSVKGLYNQYKIKKSDSLYKNLLMVATNNPVLDTPEYKEIKRDFLANLSMWGRIPHSIFADAKDFEICEEEQIVTNLTFNPLPKKTKVNKKNAVGEGQLSILDFFPEEELSRKRDK